MSRGLESVCDFGRRHVTITVTLLLVSATLFSISPLVPRAEAGSPWEWEARAPIPVAQRGTAQAYGDAIYAIGKRVQVYYPGNDTWFDKGAPSLSDRIDSTLIGDRMYIVNSWADALYYNITTGLFIDVPYPPTGRLDYAVGQVNGILYLSGGWVSGDSTSINVVEAYNPANNTWWRVAPMTVPRKDHSMVTLNGSLYAIAGVTGFGWSRILASVERYDPATNTWTAVAPLKDSRASFDAAVVDDEIVVVGGHDAASLPVEVYLPDRDLWCKGPTLPETGIGRNSVASHGGYVYTISGEDAWLGLVPRVWRWDGKDEVPPTVSAADGPDPVITGATIVFNASVEENAALEAVTLEVRDPSAALIGNHTMTYLASSGKWEVGLIFSDTGTYSYTVWAGDIFLNWGHDSGTFTVVLPPDVTPPTLTAVDAPDPQITGRRVWINVTATDNRDVSSVLVCISDPGGSDLGNHSMVHEPTTSLWSYNATFTALGTYDYVVWANDTSDNWASTAGQFTIVIPPDHTHPLVQASDSPDPQAIGSYVNITASASDDVGVAGVRVNITAPDGTTQNLTMTCDASWHCYVNFVSQTGGDYSYVVLAWDDAGNWGSASGTFRYSGPTDNVGGFLQDWRVWLIVAILVGTLLILLLARRRRRAPASGKTGSSGEDGQVTPRGKKPA